MVYIMHADIVIAIVFLFRGATYVYVLFFVNLTGYALGVGGTASMAQHAFLEDWKPAGSPRF